MGEVKEEEGRREEERLRCAKKEGQTKGEGRKYLSKKRNRRYFWKKVRDVKRTNVKGGFRFRWRGARRQRYSEKEVRLYARLLHENERSGLIGYLGSVRDEEYQDNERRDTY